MSIREAARRVDRDVKAVHGDVTALLPDESTPYTDAVFELLGTRNAVMPPLFVSECANVFLRLARQKRLDPDSVQG